MSIVEAIATERGAVGTSRRGDYHPTLLRVAERSSADYAVASRSARIAKRALDVVAVAPLLALLLVVAPVLVTAIAASSRGPIFFRQVRTGKGGRQFTMFKFRTMHSDAEERLERDPELMRIYLENDYKIPVHLDPRVTTVGKLMRKLSIDELPQALNVLLGHMSLVGPRPIVAQQVIDLYGSHVDAYLATRPGLTGRWQVSGRSEVTRADRAEIDLAYAEQWSLVGDLAILARTIPTVLSTRGAH